VRRRKGGEQAFNFHLPFARDVPASKRQQLEEEEEKRQRTQDLEFPSITSQRDWPSRVTMEISIKKKGGKGRKGYLSARDAISFAIS